MVNKEQASIVAKLKRQLNFRATTNKEFETAKKALLNKKPISGIPPFQHFRAKKLRFLGLLGLLSLGVPWEILSWSTEGLGTGGKTIFWHFFGWTFVGYREPKFIHLFQYLSDPTSLLLLSLALIGFISVLAGSFLLLQQKRLGGKLLLLSLAPWLITYAIYFTDSPYLTIPIGAMLCGIGGVISSAYKK